MKSETRLAVVSALAAGSVAITANSLALAGFDALGVRTAHGGLLRLLQIMAFKFAVSLGVAPLWRTEIVHLTSGPQFQLVFHGLVGLLMALAYAWPIEPILSGRPWVKGLTYALFAWLLNALIVLPMIGEGIAGSRHLRAVGIMGFAAAHTLFFVSLAFLYAQWRRPRRGELGSMTESS